MSQRSARSSIELLNSMMDLRSKGRVPTGLVQSNQRVGSFGLTDVCKNSSFGCLHSGQSALWHKCI